MVFSTKYIRQASAFILIFSAVFIGLLTGYKAGLLLLIISILSFFVVFSFNSYKLLKIPQEFKFYFVLVLLSVLSTFYAIDIIYSLDVLFKIIASFFIMLFCTHYIKNINQIFYLIRSYLISSSALTYYNIYYYKETIFRELPYGGVNPVALIMFSSISLVILLVILKKSKLFLLLLPQYFYLLFLTQSQKSILSLLIVFIVFALLTATYDKLKIFLKYVLYGFLIILFSLFLLKKYSNLGNASERTLATIETIYTGDRVEGAAGGVGDDGLRDVLKERGWQYFADRPFFGYGINNFRILFGRETGLYTYSHFTPVELGIGYGFSGILLYYSIYWLILKKTLRDFLISKSNASAFLFSVIIALIIIGFFMQTYFDATVNFILIISLILVNKFSYPRTNET